MSIFSKIFAGVLVGCFFLTQSVHAQEVVAPPRSLRITPLHNQYNMDPGQSRIGEIEVRNLGSQALRLKFYAEVFGVKGEDYDFEFKNNPSLDGASWISFAPEQDTLLSGEGRQISFTIKVPAAAKPGGYYMALFAEGLPGGSDLAVGQRVGSLLYLQVNGDLVKHGQIASFDSPWWQPTNPLNATLRMRNEGNTHYRASGEVTFKNLLGISRYQLPISSLILPQTTRRIEITKSPEVLLPGIYLASGKVSVFDQSVDLPKRLVVIMPPQYWLILLAAAIIVCVVVVRRSRRGPS